MDAPKSRVALLMLALTCGLQVARSHAAIAASASASAAFGSSGSARASSSATSGPMQRSARDDVGASYSEDPGMFVSQNAGGLTIPGSRQTLGALASTSDGMSRYLAPNGPIQPAIAAIGGLPLRGAQLANRGISSISSEFDRNAQRLSKLAGQNGQIQMPGMSTIRNYVPSELAQMGSMMQGAIRSKNNFIRGQAESAFNAADRMRDEIKNGLRRSRRAATDNTGEQMVAADTMSHGAGQMLGGLQDAMMKGGAQMRDQLKGSLGGHMNRMQDLQGIGQNLVEQTRGLGQTAMQGLQGAASHLQQTGNKMMSQMQQGHNKSQQQMAGILGSMQNSMGQLRSNMGKNMSGLSEHAQKSMQQLSGTFGSVLQMPKNALQQLGSMMQGLGAKGQQTSGARY